MLCRLERVPSEPPSFANTIPKRNGIPRPSIFPRERTGPGNGWIEETAG